MGAQKIEDVTEAAAEFQLLCVDGASEHERSEDEITELKDQIKCLKKGLQAATSSLQAVQNAHKAEIAFIESGKETEMMAIKSTAVKRVKQLMSDVEKLKMEGVNATRSLSADGASESSARSEGTCAPQLVPEHTQKQIKELEEQLEGEQEVIKDLAEQLKAMQQHSSSLELKVTEGQNRCTELEQQLLQRRQQMQEVELKLARQEGQKTQEVADMKHQADIAAIKAEQLESELRRLKTALTESSDLQDNARQAVEEAEHLRAELRRESLLRKRAHNELRELKGNIRVLCRVRPATAGLANAHRAQDGTAEIAIRPHDEFTVHVDTVSKSVTGKATAGSRRYEFDSVLGEQATQEDVYTEVRELVQSAHDGFNVCIFAYGQTGSGKTYTMRGTKGKPGILPQAAADIFAGDGGRVNLKLKMSILELYQDNLVDLLADPGNRCKLNVRMDDKQLVFVENAQEQTVHDAAALEECFEVAMERRATAATHLNAESSRSHLICMMRMQRRDTITGTTVKSKLSFVDLAGSERVARSGALEEKDRLDEARAINKSLSALGDVISALTSGERHIPYRNHKLTELMSDSLGGSAKTLMVVNVSPLHNDSSESKNSLDYAQRVKEVTNESSRNFETAEIARLKAIIEDMKAAGGGGASALSLAPPTPGLASALGM